MSGKMCVEMCRFAEDMSSQTHCILIVTWEKNQEGNSPSTTIAQKVLNLVKHDLNSFLPTIT